MSIKLTKIDMMVRVEPIPAFAVPSVALTGSTLSG